MVIRTRSRLWNWGTPQFRSNNLLASKNFCGKLRRSLLESPNACLLHAIGIRRSSIERLRRDRVMNGASLQDCRPRLAGRARRMRVDLVHLVSLVQPNKPDRPNTQERPAGPRVSRATVCGADGL